MKWLNKRPVAFAVLAVVILFSCIVGSYRSVLSLRQQTEQVFLQGERGDGLSIAHDLEARVRLSGNLVTIARRYLDDTRLTELQSAADALTAAQTPSEKYQANRKLDTAFQAVYESLEGQALSKTDSDYRIRLRADFHSRNVTISHDAYNGLAQEFNQKVLGSFPAGALASAAGIAPLELYG